MAHTCHAHGCNRRVPPKMFACREHWFVLPKDLRDAVWREYRRGQETDKRPSARYMAIQRFAVATLAFKPRDEEAARIAGYYMIQAETWRTRAIEGGHGDPFDGLIKEPPTMITEKNAEAFFGADVAVRGKN